MARISIENLKSLFESGDRPDEQAYVNLIDTLISQATDLGSTGNNELEISGIENATVIDSFADSEWRMIKYLVSLSSAVEENAYYATEISILVDDNDINVTEYGSLDNDGDVGTISVSRANGNVLLTVTPNPSVKPITVRYARIGLKV